MTISHRTELQIREYREADEADVLRLLGDSLGAGPIGHRAPDFWRWKHFANPFGPSFVIVAEAGGEIIGVRPFMRWGFTDGRVTFKAVRAVDTATHPQHQGKGIFSRLTRGAIDEIRPYVDFVFNTPNDKSGPGYLKLGWRAVGRVPIGIRIRRPIRFARRIRSFGMTALPDTGRIVDAETAREALADTASIERFLADAEPARGRLATPRDVRYLRWRYADVPSLRYHAVRRVRADGTLRGIALFRVRTRGDLVESVVAELIVRASDGGTARWLLRRVGAAAAVDHVVTSFPRKTTAIHAARLTGHVRAPGGMFLVTNPLRPQIAPEPTELRSWALTLGDLEVF